MSLEDLKTKASELFEVGPSMLRFDKEFEEFVDVEKYSEIQNSDKLKVVVHEKQQTKKKRQQKQTNKIKKFKSFQTVGENIFI